MTYGSTADPELPGLIHLGAAPWKRIAYVWTRAVGTGGLLIASTATFVGPNMWNLGRIIAAGMALVCLPVTIALASAGAPRRFPVTPRSRLLLAGDASLLAFLAVAAVWFVIGLLGWLRLADPVPLQSVLRWVAAPLAAAAACTTVSLSGETAGLPPGRLALLLADVLAQSGAAASGIMIAAAPFELVGADVRAFLVAVFTVALTSHLLAVAASARGVGAVADAGLPRVVVLVRPGRAFWGGGIGLAGVCVVLALAVPGWAGPIAGGLLGQVALCFTCAHHP